MNLKKSEVGLKSSEKEIFVPIWEKLCLSIEETAEYSAIGENRLRQLIDNNPNADFILWVGNRARIKRKPFEEYISQLASI